MTLTERQRELLEQYAAQLEEAEQNLPKEKRLERKGRFRNKYRLLEKWESEIRQYSGPGDTELVTGYRPSGGSAPVDVNEIAGLIVRDTDGNAHHFRLYRGETAGFIETPVDPDRDIRIDPMKTRESRRYVRDGPPTAVPAVLDQLGLTPTWDNVCSDGDHTFVVKNADTPYESVACETCRASQDVLSWLGHIVPSKEEVEQSTPG